jgi:hypothetical protein
VHLAFVGFLRVIDVKDLFHGSASFLLPGILRQLSHEKFSHR